MILSKVRIRDLKLVSRALFANDMVFLGSVNINTALALDTVVAASVARSLSSGAINYKVLDENGSLFGFFTTVRGSLIIKEYYIKETARTPEYFKAFWLVMQQTVVGKIYESVTDLNISNLSDYYKNKFTPISKSLSYGVDFSFGN